MTPRRPDGPPSSSSRLALEDTSGIAPAGIIEPPEAKLLGAAAPRPAEGIATTVAELEQQAAAVTGAAKMKRPAAADARKRPAACDGPEAEESDDRPAAKRPRAQQVLQHPVAMKRPAAAKAAVGRPRVPPSTMGTSVEYNGGKAQISISKQGYRVFQRATERVDRLVKWERFRSTREAWHAALDLIDEASPLTGLLA